jgi:uncharacterized surface protein with fasciclin (FAS1) repeats
LRAVNDATKRAMKSIDVDGRLQRRVTAQHGEPPDNIQVTTQGALSAGTTTQGRNGHSAALHILLPFALSLAALLTSRATASAALDTAHLRIASKGTNPMDTLTTTSPTKNLIDTAAANGSFKTFGKAIEYAGLSDTLRGVGPFTIFAPTDAAFDKLPAGKLEELFKPENKKELVSLMNYHVVNGRKHVADIGKWEAAKTIGGKSAPIKLTDDKVSIDGAQVTSADIDSSNGVIHGIDKVNMPTKQ